MHPTRSNPYQNIQTLYPPLLLPQQPLNPLITLPFTLAQSNPPLNPLNRPPHHRLGRMIRRLRQHTRCFRNRAIQRQLRAIGQRRIEPRGVEVEEGDDEDEEEERAVHAWSV